MTGMHCADLDGECVNRTLHAHADSRQHSELIAELAHLVEELFLLARALEAPLAARRSALRAGAK